MNNKPKIAVIGMGFLMSYLKPCYHNAIGDDLSKNIVAATATASTTEKKSRAMGFPVQCADYYNMLDSFRPDMIFFAPPPSAAKAMARDILAPYYEALRKENKPFPDLYAFPPNPDGKFYIDTVGSDINVVNILPNMAAKLKDRDISKESYTIFNFPVGHEWPEENLDRLKKFFSPLGYTVSVPADNFNTMLGGFVSSHISEELAISVSRGLKKAGVDTAYSDIASAMRHSFLKQNDRHIDSALPCSPLFDGRLDDVLGELIKSWMEGMLEHYRENGMSEALGREILIPQIDIFLQSAQLLTEDEIEYNNSCHATKGGILEKALAVFHGEIEKPLEDIFSVYPKEGFDAELYDFICEKGHVISKAVSEHAKRFAD